ncbi:MAG TPA: hypothetical protein PLV92_15955, partial [Pirellulaceae bacterium]|nr:hypothetical protein [Pirellulaceae bacterium]
MAALWRDVEALSGGVKASDESPLFPTPPVLTNPRAWRDLEHQLLHLEQLVAAGAAYDTIAKDEYRSLRRQVNEMQRRKKEESGDTLAARWRVWDEAGAPWPVKEPLPGLAVSEQLGLARDSSPQWRQRLAAWAAEGRPANDAAKPTPSDLDFQRLSERQLLHLLTAYGVGAEWKSPDLVRASWERFDFFEQLAARHDPRAHRALRPHLDQGDALRRQALDRLLAGRGAGAEEPWAEFDAWREQQFNGETSVARRIARAWSVRDAACARLPYIAQWLSGPWWFDADQDPSAASLNDPIIFEIVPLAQTLKRLCDQLEQVDERAEAQAEPAYLRTTDEVQQALARLESRWVAQYRALVAQEGAFGPVAIQRAKQLLDTPLPEASQRAELLKRLAANVTPPANTPANTPASTTTTKATPNTITKTTTKDGDDDGKSEPRPYVLSTSEQLQRELTWHPHPLVALLQIDPSIAISAQPSAASTTEGGAARGGNVRANSGRRGDSDRASESRGALARHIATGEKADSKSIASADAVGADGNPGADGGIGGSDREGGDGALSPTGVVASEKDKPTDSSTMTEAERWRYFERLGQRVREHFIAIAAGAAVDGVDAEVAAEPDSPRGLAVRERQFRIAAPLMTLVPGRDPVQRNQRHQLQEWLVWHARRTLDDLLGVGPMSPTSVVSREPFFVRATDRYLTWSIASLAESTGRTPPE